MYLGVPTINGRASRRDYQYLVDKISKKLSGWKTKTLSIAGRATLAQTSLVSIPFYTMHTTRLPRAICDEVDKKVRGFLWGDTEEKKRMHLVAWEKVTKPKVEGGLGIRPMRKTNAAFLAKLGWRVLAEKDTLWSRVMRAKYCDNRCDVDMFQARADASNAWKGIVENINVVQKGVNMAVGNGRRTFFWHHRWATDEPLLSMACPEPPVAVQDVTVDEMWDPNTGWKIELFADYLPPSKLKEIAAHELVDDEEGIDEIYWNGSASGKFTIKSALQLIREEGVPNIPTTNGWRDIWNISVPQKICFFMWLVTL